MTHTLLQYAQICVMMMKRFVTENKKHCCQQFFSPSPFLPQKRTNLGMFVCNLCIAGTRREGLANIFAEEQRPCNLLFLSLFSRLLRWCFSSVPQIWMLAARFNFRRPTPPPKKHSPTFRKLPNWVICELPPRTLKVFRECTPGHLGCMPSRKELLCKSSLQKKNVSRFFS